MSEHEHSLESKGSDSFAELADSLERVESLQEKLDDAVTDVLGDLNDAESELESLREEVEQERAELQQELSRLVDLDDVDDELLEAFVEKPYTMIPRGDDEAWVIVPRWVPFNVGWLERQDDSYNHFVVNKYVNWISELPSDIKDSVGIEQEFDEATVEESIAEFADESERDRAWDMLGGREGGLYQRKGDEKIKIKSGKEFDVIAELIENGNLPFSSQPVKEADLRSDFENVELRSYQERAWEKFKETGMVGVYWPPGTGKTFLALYAGDRLRGKKLIVVPQKTLEEQWEERIAEFCEHPEEWDIRTYQYLTYGDNMEEYNQEDLVFTVWDEAHRLPSQTYSKLSTLDTKYRMGLTASPYREDEKTKFIFALTGYPVGLNWDEFVELGVTEYPDVRVYLHRTQRQKAKTAQELADDPGKMVFFCDEIDAGKKLADKLDAPFVYGETSNRMDVFRNNRVIVSSRVGDEGMSLPSLSRVVEFSFHGGSRRQEIQRAGRVMHNDTDGEAGEHIVLMTDDEYEKFGDRLLSLEEKGFNIEYIRQA